MVALVGALISPLVVSGGALSCDSSIMPHPETPRSAWNSESRTSSREPAVRSRMAIALAKVYILPIHRSNPSVSHGT